MVSVWGYCTALLVCTLLTKHMQCLLKRQRAWASACGLKAWCLKVNQHSSVQHGFSTGPAHSMTLVHSCLSHVCHCRTSWTPMYPASQTGNWHTMDLSSQHCSVSRQSECLGLQLQPAAEDSEPHHLCMMTVQCCIGRQLHNATLQHE